MQSPASPSSVPESAIDAWSSGGRKPQFGCSDRKIKAPAAQGHVQRRHKGTRSSCCLIAAVRNHQIKEVFIFPPLKVLQDSEWDSLLEAGPSRRYTLHCSRPDPLYPVSLRPLYIQISPKSCLFFSSVDASYPGHQYPFFHLLGSVFSRFPV